MQPPASLEEQPSPMRQPSNRPSHRFCPKKPAFFLDEPRLRILPSKTSQGFLVRTEPASPFVQDFAVFSCTAIVCQPSLGPRSCTHIAPDPSRCGGDQLWRSFCRSVVAYVSETVSLRSTPPAARYWGAAPTPAATACYHTNPPNGLR